MLVETCRYNPQTALLTQMGVAKYHTLKQLVLQGEHAEEIIARVGAKEKRQQTKTWQTNVACPKSSSQPGRRDTLATEVKLPSKTQ